MANRKSTTFFWPFSPTPRPGKEEEQVQTRDRRDKELTSLCLPRLFHRTVPSFTCVTLGEFRREPAKERRTNDPRSLRQHKSFVFLVSFSDTLSGETSVNKAFHPEQTVRPDNDAFVLRGRKYASGTGRASKKSGPRDFFDVTDS